MTHILSILFSVFLRAGLLIQRNGAHTHVWLQTSRVADKTLGLATLLAGGRENLRQGLHVWRRGPSYLSSTP